MHNYICTEKLWEDSLLGFGAFLCFPNSLKRVKFLIKRNLEQRKVGFILGH